MKRRTFSPPRRAAIACPLRAWRRRSSRRRPPLNRASLHAIFPRHAGDRRRLSFATLSEVRSQRRGGLASARHAGRDRNPQKRRLGGRRGHCINAGAASLSPPQGIGGDLYASCGIPRGARRGHRGRANHRAGSASTRRSRATGGVLSRVRRGVVSVPGTAMMVEASHRYGSGWAELFEPASAYPKRRPASPWCLLHYRAMANFAPRRGIEEVPWHAPSLGRTRASGGIFRNPTSRAPTE